MVMLLNYISTGLRVPPQQSWIIFLKDRANEIYKKVEDLKSIRGRNQDAILAACLYIACRQEDRPRTVKGIPCLSIWMLWFRFCLLPWSYISPNLFPCIEICSVANGATKKEIGRAKEFIIRQLEVEMGQSMEMGTIHAGDFLVSRLPWDFSWHILSILIVIILDTSNSRTTWDSKNKKKEKKGGNEP